MSKIFYVYILCNKPRGTLYIGVTSDISRRIFEHQEKLIPGFTSNYNVTRLVYVEEIPDAETAIRREKQLKNWHRHWKINLIESLNPEWEDLHTG